MVTRKDVAKMAGVSEGTVSHVINGKIYVKPEKKDKVLKAIEQLKYIPNQAARSLVTSRSKHIGIAIYETTNPYHMEIAKVIEERAITKGYMVSLFMLDNNMEDKLHVMSERRLDGLINFMTNDYPTSFISELVASGTVLVNFKPDLGSIFGNNYLDATLDILKKMQELGHKKIAYLSTLDEVNFGIDTRGVGWNKGVKEFGFEDARVYYNHAFNSKSEDIGYDLAKKMIKDFPEVTALICTNDLSAMGAMRALADAGYKIPDDISVVGCDDISLSKTIVPSLTTLGIDKTEQGIDMAESIINQIEGGSRDYKTYMAKAIYRESLCKVKKS